MWNSILEILERKSAEGVEVRFMYDGMCSILLLPYSYPRRLRAKGIRAKLFSPIIPMLSTSQNNRDHRKILVIDGRVAYTGGVNLADEYINEVVKYGHWKDVAIKIEGEAVRSFTLMFLQMWNVSEKGSEDYRQYIKKDFPPTAPAPGLVMPYGDGPANPENVAETREEAEAFLEDCMAVVVHSVKEVREYFEEEGVDLEGADEEEILNADEVFDIGDGRYLIVEG